MASFNEPTELAPPPSSPKTSSQKPKRPWLRRVAWGTGLFWGSVLVCLVAVRVYFSDQRLRDMVLTELRKGGAEVSLNTLDLELTDGLVMEGLRIGPLPGFAQDLVRFDRLAVRWSLWDLLRLQVVMDELALERVAVALEENAQGQNVALFVQNLSGQAAPKAVPAKTTTQSHEVPKPTAPEQVAQPFSPPSLPVRVTISRIALVDLAAQVIRPSEVISINKVNVRGRFTGEGESVELSLWAGLGEPADSNQRSHLSLRTQDQEVQSQQHAFVQIDTQGFGDVRVAFRLLSEATVKKPLALPPVAASAHVDLAIDLLAAKAQLVRCDWTLGEKTFFRATLNSEQIFTAPTLALTQLGLNLDLTELAPLINAAQPGTRVAGAIAAQLAPFTSTIDALTQQTIPTTQLDFDVQHLHAQQNDLHVDDLNVTGAVKLADGNANLGLKARIGEAAAAGQTAHDIAAELGVTTPLAPFMGGMAEGAVDATLAVKVAKAGSPSAQAHGIAFDLEANVPTALALAQPSETPLAAHITLNVAKAQTPDAEANNIALKVDTDVFDLAATRLGARVDLKIREARQGSGNAALVVPGIALGLKVKRSFDNFVLQAFDVDVAGVLNGHASGSVFAATGPAPRFEKFALAFDVPRLDAVLNLLPASQRPPLEVLGAARWELALHGTVPHQSYMQSATPPTVNFGPGGTTTWAQAVKLYADYSMGWAKRVGPGLPFALTTKMFLVDVAMRDASNEFSGLNMAVDVSLLERGPRFNYVLRIDAVERPIVAKGILVETTFAGDADLLTMSFNAAAASVEHTSLTRPLVGAGMSMKGSYRLEGDLVLERFLIEAPELGLLVSTNGVVTKPLQFVMQRGWEKPLLPGIDVDLRWQLGFGTRERTGAFTHGGPVLGGKLGVLGKLAVKDGLLSLDGAMEAERFVLRAPGTSVEDMSGTFPFSLGVLFGKREGAIAVARDLPVGGGTISLLVSDTDIRQRAARPAYYDRLRPYRAKPGLSIREIHSGPYEVLDFRADARIANGIFTFDTLSMRILGGDIVGRMAVQVGRDAALRGDMSFQTSRLDASYFKLLNLQAGEASELNADFSTSFMFGPRTRDFSMDMNVTKIGSKTMDRFLMLLDPEGKDDNIQQTRSYLWLMKIYSVAMWVRYEKANMDLDYDTAAKVPFTRVSWHPVPKELLRRMDVSEYLNNYATPHLDKFVAPVLGWAHAQ